MVCQSAIARVIERVESVWDDSEPEQEVITQSASDWIEDNFYIPELEGPIRLVPYQRAVIQEAERRDKNGHYVYSMVLWSDVKKSAKSSIAAAIALYRAYYYKRAQIRIVANDLKQADTRVAFYLRRAIELNPLMKDDIKQVNYKTTLPNKSTIESVPIDPKGEAGGNDDLIIFSELWAARNRAMLQMWAEMTLSPLKFGHSQRWLETYAGYTGESPLLEPLWERATKEGESIGERLGFPDLEIFSHRGMLCLWNTIPRCPWQTPAYYTEERMTLDDSEFERVHGNRWVTSTNRFVPKEWWEDCEGELPEVTRHTPMIITLDAAVSGDCFGVLMGTNRKGHVDIYYAEKWGAPPEGEIDYQGTKDQPGPELEIIRLCKKYNVIEIRYDPYQLHDMATRLGKRRRFPPLVKFNQGSLRAVADKGLRDKIKEKRITHDGNDSLTEHVLNANAKQEGESKLRIVKRSTLLKIDLTVCLSMLAYDGPLPREKKKQKGVMVQSKTKGWA